jgi:hypothetical protein
MVMNVAERLSPAAERVLAELNRHPSGVSSRPVNWDVARELETPLRAIQLQDGQLKITEEGRKYVREKH